MLNITESLMYLFIAIIINISLGLYYNIGKQKFLFTWAQFLNGLFKALILSFSFIGLAFIFQETDLSSIGITPQMIMNAAIILYVTKAMQNLMKILGVEISANK